MEAAREQSAKRPEKSASDGDIDGVSFMAAVADNKQSPEVLIAGKPRGALSYAVARALRGGVATSDGRVSPFDIQRFVQPQIVQISEGLQVPDFKPLKLSTEPLLQLARKQAGAGFLDAEVNELRCEAACAGKVGSGREV